MVGVTWEREKPFKCVSLTDIAWQLAALNVLLLIVFQASYAIMCGQYVITFILKCPMRSDTILEF